MDNRLIRVPAGIGDSIWIMQKLLNQSERFDFQLSDAQPRRGKQLFDMLPQITASCTYQPGLAYASVANASHQFNIGKWRDIKEKGFFLSANAHVESGKRIEEYLPDLPTSFLIDYNTKDSGFDVSDLPAHPDIQSYIGIFGSSYSTTRAWNFWKEREWFDFIQKIHAERPKCIFVIIGALWDVDLGGGLMKVLRENHIPYFDTIGKPLPYVVELLKILDYFIGFPSGLSIINETLAKDTFMFYAPHIAGIMNAWAHPQRIKDGSYHPQLFCSPQEAFAQIEKLGVLDRI